MTPSTPITKRLRKAQGDSDATLHLLHQVGRVELYRRERSRRAPDYAVVRGRVTAHGHTPAEALGRVRAELAGHYASLHRSVNWGDGLALGFAPECLLQFATAYGLTASDTTTPAQLRHLVASRPDTPHRQAHIRGLRKLGIHLQ